MRSLRLLLPLLGLFMLSFPAITEACPKPKCVCDCDAECQYGKVCKYVKECKVYKSCKTKTVCFYGKDKCCGEGKVKLCHIPPGNPAMAHTLR